MLDQQGRKIPIRDIAAKAGVSPTAVSRYLNASGYVSQEKCAAISRALQELKARPEEEPPSVRGRNRRVFVFLSPPLTPGSSMQFAAMSSFFSDAAKSRGYSTRVYPANLAERTLTDVLRQIMEDHPSGILIPVVPMMELDRQTQRFIQESETPIVFLSEFLHPYPRINSIINNIDQGIGMAVAHLREQGCSRLALLTPPPTQSKSAALMQAAFRQYAQEADWPDNCMVCEFPWKNPTFSAAGYQCVRQAFTRDPNLDGIIGWVDSYTAGILWYLYEIGKRVPEDVKIITMNEDYAPYLCPPLTTISYPNQTLCTEAVEMLVRLQSPKERENVKHVYISPRFTVRRSSDPDCPL